MTPFEVPVGDEQELGESMPTRLPRRVLGLARRAHRIMLRGFRESEDVTIRQNIHDEESFWEALEIVTWGFAEDLAQRAFADGLENRPQPRGRKRSMKRR